MKVLHVGEYVQGGVATYIRTLINHPHQPEVEDYLICSDYNSDHNWTISRNHVHYYSYKRTIMNVPKAMRMIYCKIQDIKPDVVYCHSTWAGLFVRFPLLFLPKRCRVIYNAHGWAFLRDTARWKRKIYSLVEIILSLRTDMIINVSSYEYNAAQHAGISADKLCLIYSGISAIKETTPIKHFDKEKINLLFVGRFDAPKGIDYLLTEFNKCQREDIHLTVIGDNVVGDSKKIDMINSNKITFCGWIPHNQLAGYYKGCDAVIIPSRWEAFGLVGIEAMKYGKPIIVSNRGALPELIDKGENGIIFDFDNPQSLVRILDGLKKDRLSLMGKKAENLFLSKYTSDQMLNRTIQAYNIGKENA